MVASPDIVVQVDTGFISFFEKLDQQDERLIRLFDRSKNEGDCFFTCHGKDAIWVAENVYGTTTVLKYYGSKTQSQPSVSLKQGTAFEMIKDLLLKQNYKIEIWECDNRVWAISKRASPGNLRQVEDMLFTNSDSHASPVVATVSIESKDNNRLIGIAFTDASSGQKIGVAEFLDNDGLSNLESILIQHGAKEVVIAKETASTSYEHQKIVALTNRLGLVCTQVKPVLFNSANIVQDLNRLLETDLEFQTLSEYELSLAMKSTACLLSYLELLADEGNIGAYSLMRINLDEFMKLDASAVQALNLMPGPKEGSNKTTNLFGILNKCKTAQGARLLAQWIKQPLMDISEIRLRHQLVSVFFNNSYLREIVQETSLKAFPDLHRLSKKFSRGKASLQDVIRIYQVVCSLPQLKDHLASCDDGEIADLLNERFVAKIADFYDRLSKLQELVETTVDLAASNHHEYKIKADFDPALFQMKTRINEIVSEMRSEAKKVALDLDLEFEKKLKFECNPQYGHHLRVSRLDAGKLRDNQRYIVLKTVKAGPLFTTKTMRKLAEEQGDLEKAYAKLQSGTVKEVIQITSTYMYVLEECNVCIAELDVFLGLATAAAKAPIPYVCPEMVQEGSLELTESRHPCVELQDDVAFIENDVQLSRDSFFSIITGPNCGGKSTYIRQIGLICLMAQIGSFVPCASAQIPILDAVLARVGAGDSQLKGISTFMAEMLETAAILRVATQRSLIIIDELGRGTSTKDGFGLACAIAQHIAQHIQCFTLFATHFHEITSLSKKFEGVENNHAQAIVSDPDAEVKTLTLLYKIVPGVCDQSFGIHVAELAEFPAAVVQLAKRKAAELEGFDVDKEKQQHSQKRWKSSQEEIRRGSIVVGKFLSAVKEQGLGRLAEIKANFAQDFANNPFLQEVLLDF